MISDLTTIRDEVQAALSDMVHSNFGRARDRLAELDNELRDTPLELVRFSDMGYQKMKSVMDSEIKRRAKEIAEERVRMEMSHRDTSTMKAATEE